MRKQLSRAERIVWELVRGRQLGAKFRRQHPVDNYIPDFACVEAKLIVEVDGRSHDVAEQRVYDAERSRRSRELGWGILVVRDDDVLRDVSEVRERIASALRATPSP